LAIPVAFTTSLGLNWSLKKRIPKEEVVSFPIISELKNYPNAQK